MNTYPDLAELLGRQEELDPELACCETQSTIGPVIKHPLLFAVPYAPVMNAMINEAFRAKKAAVAEAKNTGRWDHYLWLHERPYRVHAFARIAAQLDDCTYWEQLGRLWTDSENIFEAEALWLRLLTDPARAANRGLMMTGEERAHLAALPDRSNKAAWIALEPLMAEAEAAAAERRASLWAEPKSEDELEGDDE